MGTGAGARAAAEAAAAAAAAVEAAAERRGGVGAVEDSARARTRPAPALGAAAVPALAPASVLALVTAPAPPGTGDAGDAGEPSAERPAERTEWPLSEAGATAGTGTGVDEPGGVSGNVRRCAPGIARLSMSASLSLALAAHDSAAGARCEGNARPTGVMGSADVGATEDRTDATPAPEADGTEDGEVRRAV
jgi:hypothetical protein